MMTLRRSRIVPLIKDVVTIEEQVHCSESMNNSIEFDYDLNEKAAKAKLVRAPGGLH